jgi:glycosyltransferase involved in cell wall biosynthesis
MRGWAELSRIAVVSNGIPPAFFGARRTNPVARRLLFVGQWLEMKGVSYLAEAFERLTQSAPELELWCVGTQASESVVLAAFPATLRPRVHVRSRLGPGEMEQAYREADIFVFPTLSEGSSQALLEAMAAALPIVTTAVGAAPDMLTDGVHALLVPTADATALASAVQRLLDDYSLRERLGEQARLKAMEYTCEAAYQQLLRLLEETASAANTPQGQHAAFPQLSE